MRGKRSTRTQVRAAPGITPAHAGKTVSFPAITSIVENHPRACGENGKSLERFRISRGSPPRMRGKLIPELAFNLAGRITPAHAGKTRRSAYGGVLREDHPRACGENIFSHPPRLPSQGSPPRMRGKPTPCEVSAVSNGITPAHAGKTRRSPLRAFPARDHPRACGENGSSASQYS